MEKERKEHSARLIIVHHTGKSGRLEAVPDTRGVRVVKGEDLARLLELVSAAASRTIEKGPRRTTGEKGQSEEATRNLHAVPTTPGASTQLPPIAADLEGLAVSLGVLAGKVSPEEWEFLKIFRANLRAAAERVAALETSLEVPHA